MALIGEDPINRARLPYNHQIPQVMDKKIKLLIRKGQLSDSDITGPALKEVFDRDMSEKNRNFNEMSYSVAVRIHKLGGIFRQATVKNFYNNRNTRCNKAITM